MTLEEAHPPVGIPTRHVLLILHRVVTGTYHVALFGGTPLRGAVRLHCLLQQTGGPSLEGERRRLQATAVKLHIPVENVWGTRPPYPWNGRPNITLVVDDWVSRKVPG